MKGCVSGTDIECERVDAPDQIGAESGVDGTVALDPAHRGEAFGADGDVEMRLAAAIIACVAGVAVAVIHHFQMVGRKGFGQFAVNFVSNRHYFVNPLQSLDQ